MPWARRPDVTSVASSVKWPARIPPKCVLGRRTGLVLTSGRDVRSSQLDERFRIQHGRSCLFEGSHGFGQATLREPQAPSRRERFGILWLVRQHRRQQCLRLAGLLHRLVVLRLIGNAHGEAPQRRVGEHSGDGGGNDDEIAGTEVLVGRSRFGARAAGVQGERFRGGNVG